MVKTRFILFFVLLCGSLPSWAAVNRPPQFVLLAFDGGLQLDRWQDTRFFAAQLKRAGISLQFTYFVSSVYFLADQRKNFYKGPHHKAGESEIDFGGTLEEIAARIKQVDAAASEGHEIASHLNGHFDGSSWKTVDWETEFDLYYKLIFSVKENNKMPKDIPWVFRPSDVQGFRAPYLAVSSGLWPALRDHHFRYDTSDVQDSHYWPEKSRGFWNFPLAKLKIAGSGKPTISMDYNFYEAQSDAEDDLAHAAIYETQTFETYMEYFTENYNGNRAPVSIGHHFPLFNGGAYWNAMKKFALTVCGLPEVRCVSYRQLADFMDKVDTSTLAAYRRGHFQ